MRLFTLILRGNANADALGIWLDSTVLAFAAALSIGCGILFDLDLPESGNMNLSVLGGVVHQISVILNGTMYTVVYDPPLKRDDKFSSLRRYGRIPARIDGDHLTIKWPDKTRAKGRIVRREKIEPERPWPA